MNGDGRWETPMDKEVSIDELRKFQRVPIVNPRAAKDKAAEALQLGERIRIPDDVVRYAREISAEQQEEAASKGVFQTFSNMVSNLLR